MNLQPKTATVLRDGRETEIPAAEVVQGDTVLVRPGESLSVDGVVLTGKSAVDESMLTGESMPVDKQPDDKVFGGAGQRRGRADHPGRGRQWAGTPCWPGLSGWWRRPSPPRRTSSGSRTRYRRFLCRR